MGRRTVIRKAFGGCAMDAMTPGMRRVMALMALAEDEDRHEDAEIVCEGLACWVGSRRTNRGTVTRLLRAMVLQDVSCGEGVERYALNGTGRAALRRPEVLAEVAALVAANASFTVRDDRAVPLASA